MSGRFFGQSKNFGTTVGVEFLQLIFISVFRHDTNEMRHVISTLIDAHPTLLAGYIELIRALAISRDWTQVAEAAQSASLIQNECIPVQLYECVEALVIKGKIGKNR